MNQYGKYKPSGIEWIGEIPEHWDVQKLKWLVMVNSGKTVPVTFNKSAGQYPVYGANGLIGFSDEYNLDTKAILVGRVGASGEINLTESKCWVSDNALIIELKNHLNFNFAKYLFYSINFKTLITKNAQPLITATDVKEQLAIIPSREEQRKIADYLDHKTTQIDRLVTKKQKLIELLNEEKTAIINQAVTKGLNPNTPMKDSGIPWIGEIPEHWAFKKLKYVAVIKPSNVDKKIYDGEKKVLLCNYLDVYKNEFIDNSFSFMEATASENEITKFTIKKGDVLVTKDSETPDDIANPAYIKEDLENVICGYHLAQIRANNIELIGEYLFRLFQTRKLNSHFEISANGITRFGLSVDSFQQVFVPLPPIKEQSDIIRHIQTEIQKIDTTISKVEKEIELLQEYRTALISEAVTGKIDVRI